MRILIGFFLLTGCSLLVDTPEATPPNVEIKSTESTDATDTEQIDFSELFGFTPNNMETPDPIPIDKLPELGTYHIGVRVIIEGQPAKIDGEEHMWWARTADEVRRDLDNAEQIYSDVAVKFHVSEISYREVNFVVLAHFIEANNRPGQLTIVYMLPNAFSYDGYSSGPWESVNRGIVVNYLADQWTVAHEIGHYFGLLHTFDEDYVEDTSEQSLHICIGEENATANCHNIMNYCEHEPKMITPGQIERFRRFLRAKRISHAVREYTDILLRGQPFPSPIKP